MIPPFFVYWLVLTLASLMGTKWLWQYFYSVEEEKTLSFPLDDVLCRCKAWNRSKVMVLTRGILCYHCALNRSRFKKEVNYTVCSWQWEHPCNIWLTGKNRVGAKYFRIISSPMGHLEFATCFIHIWHPSVENLICIRFATYNGSIEDFFDLTVVQELDIP